MNRFAKIKSIREKMASGTPSIGSWMQIPHPSIAEILGSGGYDWVAVDLEHGAIAVHQLPDLFRALELGDTLPLARIIKGREEDCKQALDAGAGGIIVPMIESAKQLLSVRDACRWPPSGRRGVGFSRANLFGKHFDNYGQEAQSPLLVAMIEQARAFENIEEILKVDGLDAVLIGPYDLSASLGMTGEFRNPKFVEKIETILKISTHHGIACGVHVVLPEIVELERYISLGYRFIPFSIDAVVLTRFSNPIPKKLK